jgi:hypothetical protein
MMLPTSPPTTTTLTVLKYLFPIFFLFLEYSAMVTNTLEHNDF